MTITSFDPGFVAGAKQSVSWVRTGARTTVAAGWFGMLDVAGTPGGGTLAGTSTGAGVVPTDATAGFPVINAFGGGATGYIAAIDFGNTIACRMRMSDMLFKAGAYAFNANTALAAQPSYSGRLPGTDYKDTLLYVEAVTAFTGNPTFTITYTNQDGVGSRTATLAAGLAPTLGRRLPVPLQSGDTGIQKIDNVQCTVATAGTFNVLVLRPLWTGRVRSANDGDLHGLDRAMMPEVYDTSAIDVMLAADSTSSGVPELEITIVNG